MELRQLMILGGMGIAVGVSSSAFAGHDPVIYSNGVIDYGIASPASQLDLNYPFDAGAADDFMLGPSGQGDNSWNISDVHWSGVYFNGSPINIASFNIIFWPDVGGVPGGGTPAGNAPDYTQALAIYNIAGNGNEALDPGNPDGFHFLYSVDLPATFNAQANTSYWIEVQPVFTFPPQWAFGSVTGVTGAAGVQGFDFLGIQFWTGTNTDRDFQLSGTPVPAPGALALLGIAGLAGMRRRRRK